MPWAKLMSTLGPNGRLITVGAVAEPMAIPAFSMIGGGKSVGGSDTGSPAMVAKMLEFCMRHNIKPMAEYFPMSEINRAIKHLESGHAAIFLLRGVLGIPITLYILTKTGPTAMTLFHIAASVFVLTLGWGFVAALKKASSQTI